MKKSDSIRRTTYQFCIFDSESIKKHTQKSYFKQKTYQHFQKTHCNKIALHSTKLEIFRHFRLFEISKKTIVSLLHSFRYFRWKQFFICNSPQSPWNLNFWRISVTMRLFTQFQLKTKTTKLHKKSKFYLGW